MIEVRCGKTGVARTAHVESAHGLRNGALYSCSFVIARLEFRSCLSSSCCPNSKLCLTRMQCQLRPPLALRRPDPAPRRNRGKIVALARQLPLPDVSTTG